MAKQLTAPGCTYSIVARVDTTIYSPDQKWTLDVSAGQTDFIAETNEIIIPGDAMLCRKTRQHSKDRNRINLLGTGSGSLATFVTRAVEQIVGKGNVKVEYGAGKVTVALASSATDAQIAVVENLLERMLPKDVVGEIDPFPTDYTRVEWLRSYPKGSDYYSGAGYIILDDFEYNQKNDTIEIETEHFMETHSAFPEGYGQAEGIAWAIQWAGSIWYGFPESVTGIMACNSRYDGHPSISTATSPYDKWTYFRIIKSANRLEGWIDEVHKVRTTGFNAAKNIVYKQIGLWCSPPDRPYYTMIGKKRFYKMQVNGKMIFDMVPALDNTGAPCMFNRVTRTPHYSDSSVDFLYPDAETQATTYSLRTYAQLTPHGLRRLYHVPDGYNGSKEEYAAEHGFKPIIETPHPEEGYWMPVWHDREDRIELEWVETEPPAEEASTTQVEQ